MNTKSYECCIIGAGPAGLGVAYELVKQGKTNILIIDKNKQIGGLSRTEVHDNIRFDIGPHRFFSNNKEVNNVWHDTLGNDFIPVNRLTRIYYKNKYFNYPVKAFDTLSKLGISESTHAIFSYLLTLFANEREPKTFEDWISQKFGKKLYSTFFKTYTEKIWGIPCNEIEAEWAAQRIKGLDIVQVLKSAISFKKNTKIKTLVEQFDYPINGAGQMYEVMADELVSKGVTILLDQKINKVNIKNDAVSSIEVLDSSYKNLQITANQFFSSIPFTDFFNLIKPKESETIINDVDKLYFRDHITVNLLVDHVDLFPDQWIYIHDPKVNVARIANYNNFSSKMVSSHTNKTAVSFEYFVFKNDDVWNKSDDQIAELAKVELDYLKLFPSTNIEKIWITRETECYPTYFIGYKESFQRLQKRFNQLGNIYAIGRGGMYKYNNQDHSLLSGILAARKYCSSTPEDINLWEVNTEKEYHESGERI